MPDPILPKSSAKLPIIDCGGCGVCCFHMGYPPFIRPIAPMTTEEMEADDRLRAEIAGDPQLKQQLAAGRPGEKWWYELPADLKSELDSFIANYEHREYTDDVSSFDGPCCWFDMETRQCKHHLHRPNVCREFEIGSRQCLEWRKFYRAQIR
jgi:Fe-S-cluster containining protein